MKFKKALTRVAVHPADKVRVLPAPTQEKEEDLTNSIGGNLLTIHLFSGEMVYGTISSTEAIEIVLLTEILSSQMLRKFLV